MLNSNLIFLFSVATLLPELKAELEVLHKKIVVLEEQIEELQTAAFAKERDSILLNKNEDFPTEATMGVPHVSAEVSI